MPAKIIDEVFDQVEMEFANRNWGFIWASSADRRRVHDTLRRTLHCYEPIVWIGERKANSRPKRDPASELTAEELNALDGLQMRIFYEVVRYGVTASSSLIQYPPLFNQVLRTVIRRPFERGILAVPPASTTAGIAVAN